MKTEQKTAIENFQSVIPIELTVDISDGQQKTFNIEVKPLEGEKLLKHQKDLEKSFASNKKSKEDKKAVDKARKVFVRLKERHEDLAATISMLRESNKDGLNNEVIIDKIEKKELLEKELWNAEDALSVLIEDDAEMSEAEIIVIADKEMKKLFNLLVIKDDGLSDFMEKEKIGYTGMVHYIKRKIDEAVGNARNG